jgi:hypothetical protein
MPFPALPFPLPHNYRADTTHHKINLALVVNSAGPFHIWRTE